MSKKHKQWFIEVRGSYLPNSWQAWVTYIPYTAWLLITAYWSVRYRVGLLEVAATLIPLWVSGVVIMHWVATITSGKH